MDATTYSNFRQNLKDYMNRINDNSETIIVTSKDEKNVVVMSQNDYNNIIENIYLFSNEANRAHITESIAEMNSGEYEVISLDEL